MPVIGKILNADGTLNLDMTAKVMRTKYNEIRRYPSSADSQLYYNPITGGNTTFKGSNVWGDGKPVLISSSGAVPSKSLRLVQCADSNFLVCSPQGIFSQGGCSSTLGDVTTHLITETWADSGSLPIDPLKIYSPTGELMWSAATIADAVIFEKRLECTSIHQVMTFTSTNGRKLFINEESVFSSGAWDGEGPATSSGVMARWSLGGTKLEVAYFTKSDGDISQALALRGKLTLDVYSICGIY